MKREKERFSDICANDISAKWQALS